MQKKKGFTLIELLAVIVILAIIALIATPIVLNIIEEARKGAAKSSAYGVVESLKLKYAESLLDGNFKGSTYNSSNWNDLGISSIPEDGNVILDNNGNMQGNVTYNGYTFYICNDKVSEEDISTSCSVEEVVDYTPQCIKDGYCANGTAIYFNPETNEYCDSNIAVSTTGTKTGCMKWYAFNDSSESTTVNLLLDHNTTATVAWNSTGSNSEMKEVVEALSTDTATWNESIKSTARLITADEIVQLTNNTTWSSATATDRFYFENHQTTRPDVYSGQYAWLYDYTSECIKYGCNIEDSSNYGYWTSTIVSSMYNYSWYISREGNVTRVKVDDGTHCGLRPVITVSKSNI